jgi:hypothetical protein
LSRTPASAGNRKTWTWAGWVKRSALSTAAVQSLFVTRGSPSSSATWFDLYFTTADRLYIGNYDYQLRVTSQVFRDTSAWYHILVACDTTQASAANRLKLYVNGTQVSDFTLQNDLGLNEDTGVSNAIPHYIGSISGTNSYFSGYLADIHFIDGQALTPSSFGEFSATTGVWVPKAYTGTYGTNGFQLKFEDNSSNTATTLGKDTSGNNNNWTPNNLTVALSNSITFPNSGSPTAVDYLVIGGGGGGGGFAYAGGGGAGGYLTGSTAVTAGAAYVVTVGAGGSGGVSTQDGFNGSNSVFGALTAIGGGGGGGFNAGKAGKNGGSGGGSNYQSNSPGLGTAGQGNNGGSGFSGGGGGGGGAGAAGSGSSGLNGGAGGAGLSSSITGTAVTRAGGGGGGAIDPSGASGAAGSGGGGIGGNGSGSVDGGNGVANTGGGGGGAAYLGSKNGGNGGSGVVIIRYPDTFADLGTIGGGLTYTRTTTGGYKIYTFTASSTAVPEAGIDSLVDVPTNGSEVDTGLGGQVRGNYCTFNPLSKTFTGTITFSNGNLDVAESSGAYATIPGTIAISSGKFYWEITRTSTSAASIDCGVGLVLASASSLTTVYSNSNYTYRADGTKIIAGGGYTAYGASWATGDVIGVAADLNANTLTFYKNGVSQGAATTSLPAGVAFLPFCGDDSSATSMSWTANFGQRPFAYPLSGFKALCTANLPAGTITTSGTFTGNANADGPFVWLNGVPTAMTINGNAVTFGTHADKLANGFKVRSSSGSYNTAGSNTYSITTTGDKFNVARAQPNP